MCEVWGEVLWSGVWGGAWGDEVSEILGAVSGVGGPGVGNWEWGVGGTGDGCGASWWGIIYCLSSFDLALHSYRERDTKFNIYNVIPMI